MMAYKQIFIALLGMLIVILVGTMGFMYYEHLKYFDSLWLTMITVLTVGYGDVYPKTFSGKIFALTLIPIGIGVVTYAIGAIAAGLVEGKFSRTVGRKKMDRKINKLSQHIIVCGMGRVGQQVIMQLKQENVPFIVIDQNEESLKTLKLPALYIAGDATEDSILYQAGIERASGLVATLPVDADNVFISLTAKGINPKIQVVARAGKFESEEKLRRAGADKVINPSSIGGRRMAMSILKPISVDYVDTILHSEQKELRIEEITIQEGSPLNQKSLREAQLREKYGVTVLAVKKGDQIISNPRADEIFYKGNIVIVFGAQNDLQLFEQGTKG